MSAAGSRDPDVTYSSRPDDVKMSQLLSYDDNDCMRTKNVVFIPGCLFCPVGTQVDTP